LSAPRSLPDEDANGHARVVAQRKETALLSEEGSGIAKRMPRGVVPNPPTFT